MGFKFNPFSGNFDFAPGVGGTVFDGEVNVFSDLPETISNPPVNSAYLVRNTEGTIWFGNRKQKGIYIRSGNSGVRNDDWTYGGEYPVTSVNGQTGAVTLDADDVGALQTDFSIETYSYSGGGGTNIETLPARRNARWTIVFNVSGGTRTIILPTADVQVGDRIYLSLTSPSNTTVVLRRPQPGAPITIATIAGGQTIFYAATCTQIVSSQPVWRSSSEMSALFGIVPSTSTSSGVAGTFSFGNDAMYVCIASDTWRRVPIAAF